MSTPYNDLILLTDKLETHYSKELSVGRIMKNHLSGPDYLTYLLNLFFLILSLLGTLILGFFSVIYTRHELFYISIFSFFILIVLVFRDNYLITKYLLKEYREYQSHIKLKISFKNANKLLNLYRYENLIALLATPEFERISVSEFSAHFSKKSGRVSKERFLLVTIISILILSVWSEYIGAVIGSYTELTQMFGAGMFFLLTAVVVGTLILLGRKWLEVVLLGKVKNLDQLAELLQLIVTEKKS